MTIHVAHLALNHLAIGVCVVSAAGIVLLQNKEAGRIFALQDGLAVSRAKKLVASKPEITAKIGDGIRCVARQKTRDGKDAVAVVLVAGQKQNSETLVVISPMNAQDEQNHAIVFLIDRQKVSRFSKPVVLQLFGLSESEAEVCRLLVDGLSISGIARLRSVSTETVRSQVKSVYRKVGASSRGDLIRTTMSVSPPIPAKMDSHH